MELAPAWTVRNLDMVPSRPPQYENPKGLFLVKARKMPSPSFPTSFRPQMTLNSSTSLVDHHEYHCVRASSREAVFSLASAPSLTQTVGPVYVGENFRFVLSICNPSTTAIMVTELRVYFVLSRLLPLLTPAVTHGNMSYIQNYAQAINGDSTSSSTTPSSGLPLGADPLIDPLAAALVYSYPPTPHAKPISSSTSTIPLIPFHSLECRDLVLSHIPIASGEHSIVLFVRYDEPASLSSSSSTSTSASNPSSTYSARSSPSPSVVSSTSPSLKWFQRNIKLDVVDPFAAKFESYLSNDHFVVSASLCNPSPHPITLTSLAFVPSNRVSHVENIDPIPRCSSPYLSSLSCPTLKESTDHTKSAASMLNGDTPKATDDATFTLSDSVTTMINSIDAFLSSTLISSPIRHTQPCSPATFAMGFPRRSSMQTTTSATFSRLALCPSSSTSSITASAFSSHSLLSPASTSSLSDFSGSPLIILPQESIVSTFRVWPLSLPGLHPSHPSTDPSLPPTPLGFFEIELRSTTTEKSIITSPLLVTPPQLQSCLPRPVPSSSFFPSLSSSLATPTSLGTNTGIHPRSLLSIVLVKAPSILPVLCPSTFTLRISSLAEVDMHVTVTIYSSLLDLSTRTAPEAYEEDDDEWTETEEESALVDNEVNEANHNGDHERGHGESLLSKSGLGFTEYTVLDKSVTLREGSHRLQEGKSNENKGKEPKKEVMVPFTLGQWLTPMGPSHYTIRVKRGQSRLLSLSLIALDTGHAVLPTMRVVGRITSSSTDTRKHQGQDTHQVTTTGPLCGLDMVRFSHIVLVT